MTVLFFIFEKTDRMPLDCIDKIIGLSRTDCSCYDTDKPADANESVSGLYIDELEGISLKMADSPSPCEKGGLWDLLTLARENAVKVFETELLACISSVTKMKRKSFIGTVGEREWTSLITPSTNYLGWRICSPNIKGGFMRIKSITTLMDTTTTFDVHVYSNLQDTPVHTFSNIESEALKRKENDVTDLLLPLGDDKCGEELIYYLVYEPTGFKPLNNNLDCGCGSKNRNYRDFFDVDGTAGDDPTTLSGQKDFTTSSFANGLCVEMDVFCRLDDVICQHSVDASDPMFNVMAMAIQFKAGELLVDYINASGNINRFTLLNQERLWGRKNKFSSEYRTRVQYLCGEIDVTDSDCVTCDNKHLNTGTIKV